MNAKKHERKAMLNASNFLILAGWNIMEALGCVAKTVRLSEHQHARALLAARCV